MRRVLIKNLIEWRFELRLGDSRCGLEIVGQHVDDIGRFIAQTDSPIFTFHHMLRSTKTMFHSPFGTEIGPKKVFSAFQADSVEYHPLIILHHFVARYREGICVEIVNIIANAEPSIESKEQQHPSYFGERKNFKK